MQFASGTVQFELIPSVYRRDAEAAEKKQNKSFSAFSASRR
jgi:hypothetical protein